MLSNLIFILLLTNGALTLTPSSILPSGCPIDSCIHFCGEPTLEPTVEPTIEPTIELSPTIEPTIELSSTISIELCPKSHSYINTTYHISTSQGTCIKSILSYVVNLIHIIDTTYASYNISVISNITSSQREELSVIGEEPVCVNNITVQIISCFSANDTHRNDLINITFADQFVPDINQELNRNVTYIKIYITNVTIINFYEYPPLRTSWLNKPLEQSWFKYLLAISTLSSACILVFCIYKCRRKILDNIAIKFQNTIYLQKSMVIFVPIAYYENELYLDGVDVNVIKIKKLFGDVYRYDLYPKEYKLAWSQDEIINLLQKCAKRFLERNYDSIIFISSGYGDRNNILTSDCTFINKTAIHRLFSVNQPSLRDKPRVFIYDCCVIDTKYMETINMSNNIGTKDVVFTDSQEHSDYDVDHKLVTIDATEVGYQTKLTNVDGSHFIREFVISMMDNTETQDREKVKNFGKVVDQITKTLYGRNKKQVIRVSFHDWTRYMKFVVNTNGNDQENNSLLNTIDDSVKEVEMQQLP